jgi:hypothetical protein
MGGGLFAIYFLSDCPTALTLVKQPNTHKTQNSCSL